MEVLAPTPLSEIFLSDYSGLSSLLHQGPKTAIDRRYPFKLSVRLENERLFISNRHHLENLGDGEQSNEWSNSECSTVRQLEGL